MLMLRMMNAFDARTADEGRSYCSKRGGGTRLGEQVFDERVTITSDPGFTNGETAPFTGVGEPARAETWVDKGVLKSLAYSRFLANKHVNEVRQDSFALGSSANVERWLFYFP